MKILSGFGPSFHGGPKGIGMAGFLARGSFHCRAFPGFPSGMMRRRSPLTVAGQRGSCTLFPFNRADLQRGTRPVDKQFRVLYQTTGGLSKRKVTTTNCPAGMFRYVAVFVRIFIPHPFNGRHDFPADIDRLFGKKLSHPLIFAPLLIIFLSLALNRREC